MHFPWQAWRSLGCVIPRDTENNVFFCDNCFTENTVSGGKLSVFPWQKTIARGKTGKMSRTVQVDVRRVKMGENSSNPVIFQHLGHQRPGPWFFWLRAFIFPPEKSPKFAFQEGKTAETDLPTIWRVAKNLTASGLIYRGASGGGNQWKIGLTLSKRSNKMSWYRCATWRRNFSLFFMDQEMCELYNPHINYNL